MTKPLTNLSGTITAWVDHTRKWRQGTPSEFTIWLRNNVHGYHDDRLLEILGHYTTDRVNEPYPALQGRYDIVRAEALRRGLI